MCRNIRMLFNFEPPATEDEMRAAALQYVRKVSGTAAKPSKANQARFDQAVEAVARATRELLDGMETQAPARNREVEAARAKVLSAKRFGRPPA
jgi:hypothetical protein